MNRHSVINCNQCVDRVTVTSVHVGSSYLVLFDLPKMGQMPHTALLGPKMWGPVTLLDCLAIVRRSCVLLLFFNIINVIIFAARLISWATEWSCQKYIWPVTKKLTQTYCPSLP